MLNVMWSVGLIPMFSYTRACMGMKSSVSLIFRPWGHAFTLVGTDWGHAHGRLLGGCFINTQPAVT